MFGTIDDVSLIRWERLAKHGTKKPVLVGKLVYIETVEKVDNGQNNKSLSW